PCHGARSLFVIRISFVIPSLVIRHSRDTLSPMPKSRPPPYLLAALLLIPLTAAIELAMHRLPISASHRITLWASVDSPELSQQIADAYSFSHITPGLAFYAILRLPPRRKISLPLCFFL